MSQICTFLLPLLTNLFTVKNYSYVDNWSVILPLSCHIPQSKHSLKYVSAISPKLLLI